MGRGCYLAATALFQLNHAAVILNRAFDSTCYLVGSCMRTKEYRDVDVRLILFDEEYDRLFPGTKGRAPQTNALWSVMCVSISEHLSRLTGLPVDFQIQRMTQANEEYDGPRNALGIFPHYAAGPEKQE